MASACFWILEHCATDRGLIEHFLCEIIFAVGRLTFRNNSVQLALLFQLICHFPHIERNVQCLWAVCCTVSAANTSRRHFFFWQCFQTEQSPRCHIAVSQCGGFIAIVIVSRQERRYIQSLRAITTAIPAAGTGNRYLFAEYTADFF